MFIVPEHFYENTPGVLMMGPYNARFIRDAGFGMGIGGAAILWGTFKHDRSALIIGTAWPVLHASFHIFVWFSRGMPLDFVAFVNFAGIQLWAWAALYCATKYRVARS
jgi:hypothetical protein